MSINDLQIALAIFKQHGETSITIESDAIYGSVTPPDVMKEDADILEQELGWYWNDKIGIWVMPLHQRF
jgi:hypothetical protein